MSTEALKIRSFKHYLIDDLMKDRFQFDVDLHSLNWLVRDKLWLAIHESSLSISSSSILYYSCSQILQILYSFKSKQANTKI